MRLERCASMIVTLREITRDNWIQCVQLHVTSGQESFVASNAISLAQSRYEPEWQPYAVYDDGQMVGFIMYGKEPRKQQFWVLRLMVDAAYQGHGYGRAAMELAIQRMKALPDCHGIAISDEAENEGARRLYASLGFRETGEIIEGEVVARMPGSTSMPG